MKTLGTQSTLVVGLGRSGASVCEYLSARGVQYSVCDSREHPPGLEVARQLIPADRIHVGFESEVLRRFELLIVSPGLALTEPAIAAAVDGGSEVIGDIELFARHVQTPVIAVTGSNGKSTVVSWLAHVLEGSGVRAVLCGNIGQPALSSIRDDADLYVLELSSFQLETTSSLAPLSAAVLNLSEDHMDRYADLRQYATAKQRIYQHAKYVVVNRHDRATWPMIEREDCRLLSFGVGDEVPTGQYGVVDTGDDAWLIGNGRQFVRVAELRLPGEHNRLNALAVLALLQCLDLPRDVLVAGLVGFNGLPHRTQLVREIGSVRWYNDSKGTNVDACSKALLAMQAPVILIAGGIAKQADFTPLQAVVHATVKTLILIGRDAPLMHDALEGQCPIEHAATLHHAVQRAAELAEAGDVVLLSPACSSFDMFDNFEHRGNVFIQEVWGLAA